MLWYNIYLTTMDVSQKTQLSAWVEGSKWTGNLPCTARGLSDLSESLMLCLWSACARIIILLPSSGSMQQLPWQPSQKQASLALPHQWPCLLFCCTWQATAYGFWRAPALMAAQVSSLVGDGRLPWNYGEGHLMCLEACTPHTILLDTLTPAGCGSLSGCYFNGEEPVMVGLLDTLHDPVMQLVARHRLLLTGFGASESPVTEEWSKVIARTLLEPPITSIP
jgi:hypothetical protein